MVSIFNKQFRQEEKLFSDLRKKIKKSEKITKKYTKTSETYALDTINIEFNLNPYGVIVKDKAGKQIIALDCHYDSTNDMQEIRANHFHDLLVYARFQFSKRQEKLDKIIAANKKVANEYANKQREKAALESKQLELKNALERLKALKK